MSSPDRTYVLWERRMRKAEHARTACDKVRAACEVAMQRAADAFVGWLASGPLREACWRPDPGTGKEQSLLSLPSPIVRRITRALHRLDVPVNLLEDHAEWWVIASLRTVRSGTETELELRADARDEWDPDAVTNCGVPEPPDIREVARRLRLDVDWKGAGK